MTSDVVISRRFDFRRIGRFVQNHYRTIAIVAALWLGLNLLLGYLLTPPGQDVLNVAYAYPDGGGYCPINDTGVAQTIKHNGETILMGSKNGSTYCCGFTFQVAMQAAEQRGLLNGKSVWQLRQFQQEWYGTTKKSALKQCATAMEDLRIGREIAMKDAQPGDFAVFSRVQGPGHSVVFLNWMRDEQGQIVGLRYRSSQGSTRGVADNYEYFWGSGLGRIDRQSLFIGRLNKPLLYRLFHPFGG